MSRIRGGKIVEYVHKKEQQLKTSKDYTKVITALTLVSIFFLVMFLTCYFNYNVSFNPQGTTLSTRFFLGGPDPYLNMREAEITFNTGAYPFTAPHGGDADPLLNYPVGQRGSRPPLLTLVTVASAHVLNLFTSSTDALGFAMIFLPAIYGALLVFPVYGIARTLFNRKVGIVAAFLVALMPIHIGGSHGALLGLYDHDSFILLLFACLYFFIIKMLKEPKQSRSFLYAGLSGLIVGALYLTWTASQLAFMLPIVGLFVIMLFDIFKNKTNIKNPLSFVVLFSVAYLVALPYAVIQGAVFDLPFISLLASVGILGIYFLINKVKIPWIISVPTLASIGAIGMTILYLGSIQVVKLQGFLYQLAINIFGEGIYGSKVSQTVAEAHTFGISQNIMSFGPVLYWIGLGGFLLYIIKTHKEKWKAENIFLIFVFVLDFYLTTTAGRFLNDLIPTFVVFAGFFVCLIMDKVNLKQMIKNMKYLDGFEKRKALKVPYILGILFVVFLLILPNAILALDASIPAEKKGEYFGTGWQGAFGTSLSKEYYWADAFNWLSTQDTNIPLDANKPAFISWWDYGFYEAAMGKHPTVADNYQVGMYASGNFKLSATEQEATSVLIVRCCEGAKSHNKGTLPGAVKDIFRYYLPPIITNTTTNATSYPAESLIQYIEDPTTCPTYNTLDSPQYGNTIFRKRADNAMYQDSWQLMKNLSDDDITNMYKDIQSATGFSIRYYGTEQYDTQIFGVFTFLTDRGFQGFAEGLMEDDYFIGKWQDAKTGTVYTELQLNNMTQEVIQNMSLQQYLERKDTFYNTMWYKTYYGYGQFPEKRMPTYMLTHFKLAYYSPVIVISKYYEGATITGTVHLGNQTFPYVFVYVFDEYGIPHANGMSDENGDFSLIAPAGNLTLGLFTSTNDLNISKPITITEEEGRRLAPYNKTVSFQVSLSSLNINMQTNQTNLTLKVNGQSYGQTYTYDINGSQIFSIPNMTPQDYSIIVEGINGTEMYNEVLFVKPGDNSCNVTI